jgi:hypothetical protein
MLQAAYGGYENIYRRELEDDPIYYEPGFDGFLTPLEIESTENETDIVYIVLRKRSDGTGSNFEDLLSSSLSVSAVDATTGEAVGASLNSNVNFEDSPWSPDEEIVVLAVESQLNLLEPNFRVRVIDCTVSDTTDNDFIFFRIVVPDTDLNFHYIPVRRSFRHGRERASIEGKEANVDVYGDSESYVLFSPYTGFSESTKDKADFSYPEDSTYYKRQDSFNNEDFSIDLVSVSDPFLEESISVMNVPSYGKAGLILIDRTLRAKLAQSGRSAYADILITCELSGRIDTFRVHFYKGI